MQLFFDLLDFVFGVLGFVVCGLFNFGFWVAIVV